MSRMTAKQMKIGAFVGACIVLCLICCGYKMQEMNVVILDGRVRTELTVKAGTTVQDALLQAEIPLDGRDLVEPERDALLTDADSEIVISRCARVMVSDDDVSQPLELIGGTVADAFEELGIALNPRDYVNHSPEGFLEDGMEIFVLRRNEVTLVDGEKQTYVTTADTVSDLLEEQQVVLDTKDRIHPSLDTPLKEGMEIVIERVSVKTVKEREPIAFETKTEYSSELYRGESKEKVAGVDGEKEITYEVVYVNGKQEKKTAVSEKVIKEPVDQVIVEGTKEKVVPKPQPQKPGASDKKDEPYVVSKQKVPDCDGSGHGYYVITWSNGKVEYEDY